MTGFYGHGDEPSGTLKAGKSLTGRVPNYKLFQGRSGTMKVN
jgi:hypothetical protein